MNIARTAGSGPLNEICLLRVVFAWTEWDEERIITKIMKKFYEKRKKVGGE